MKQNLRASGILASCALLALTAAACARRQKGGPPAMPPASVQTAPALKMDAPVLVTAFGSTRELMSVDVVPQVSGILVRTFIRDGASVTNGQPLFLIDPRDYEARVRQAEGMLCADRANVELARITLERNRALREKEMISSEGFDTLKTRLDAARAQLQIDEAALEQARLNLARCTIAAPMAGLCSRRMVDEGNLVAAGVTRLTNIRSYDPILVDFSVPERDLPAVRGALAGGPVKIEIVPRGQTNACEGTLEFIDNAVSTQTGTILLRGRVPNPDLKLWAGQFVDVRVYAGVVGGAVMIPEGAVQYGKQGTYAFAVSDAGRAEMRPVKTGVRHRDLIQAVSGVAAGERVVVLGQLMLYPGAAVMEAPAGAHGAPPGAAASAPPGAGAAKAEGPPAAASGEAGGKAGG